MSAREAVVIATHSRKQTHSEGPCRWWSAVYYTSRPKTESPLRQGPQVTFVKTLYTLSVLLKPTSLNSLNLAWKVLKGDTVRLQPWFIIRRVSWLYMWPTPVEAIKITEVIDYTGDYHILFDDGKSWYGIWCLSVQEASSAVGMLSPWLPGTWSKAHWKCKMEFPSFSRWSQLSLSLSSLAIRPWQYGHGQVMFCWGPAQAAKDQEDKDVTLRCQRETSQPRDTESCLHRDTISGNWKRKWGGLKRSFMQKELSYLGNVQLVGSDPGHWMDTGCQEEDHLTKSSGFHYVLKVGAFRQGCTHPSS